jgi:MraZ protein
LRLYPETYFRSLSDRLERNLLEHEHQAEFEESLFPFAVLLDMDSAGRVVLPADAIQLAGLGREVTVAGVRDHLEISNREEFNQRKLSAWRNYSANQQRARQSLQQESQGRQTGPVAG